MNEQQVRTRRTAGIRAMLTPQLLERLQARALSEPWKGRDNAEPVNNGRCCSDCNQQVVIPIRDGKIVPKGAV